MHKKTSFAKRAMSLLLVAVMVLGMLPGITLPVSAIGSGSGSSDGGSSIRGPVDSWSSTDQYFTRFTLIEINTPDDDSMPGSSANLFTAGDNAAVLNNIRVIGSVNVSSDDKPVTKSGIDWVDSNMIEYQQQAVSASSKDDAKQKIIAYANKNSKSDFPVITWQKLCEEYRDNCATADNDVSGKGKSWERAMKKKLSSWTDGSDPDDFMMVRKTGSQTDDLYESTGFPFYAIVDYLLVNAGESVKDPESSANKIGYTKNKWDAWMSNTYLDNDGKSYRVLMENGRVFAEKGGTRLWAGTTRDCIAFSMETGNKNFGHDQGWVSTYNLASNLQGDAPNFYGYRWNDSTREFDLSEGGGTFIPGKLPEYSQKKLIENYLYYPLLGLDSDAKSGKLWGAAIYAPYYHAEPQGMKISKVVENGSEADKQKDFVFDVSIDVGGSEPTGATLVLTTPGGGSSDEQPLKDAVDDYMFDGTKITFKIMLRHGASISIKGLPKGASYTVTEEGGGTDQDKGDNGYYTTVSDSGADDKGKKPGPSTSGKLTEGDVPSASVSFMNSPKLPVTNLTVTKTVEISDVKNQGKTFDFTVQVNGATPGEYTAVFSPGGEQTITGTSSGGGVQFTFTLGGGGSVIIDGLPIGASYTVTEAPVSGFTTTKTGDSGTLEASGATASFTNKDSKKEKDTEEDDPGERYWVFWDLNYDGGGVTSCEGGEHFLQWGHPHNEAVSDYPQRNGYTFKGWALDDADADEGLFTVADPGGPNHTFFAVWEAMTIVWDANGGTFADGKETQAYAAKVWHEEIPVWENCHEATVWEDEDGFALETPQWVPTGGNKKPNRKGYTFNGWYMDKECTQPIETYEEGVYPGRTYYAGWTAEKVVVTYYDTRYGTGTVVRQDEYLYNDVIDILDGMTSTDGWKWAGWWTERGDGGTNVTDWDGKVHLSDEEVAENGGKLVPRQNADLPDGSVMSDKYYWTLDIYAHWNEELTNYMLHLVYNDFQNNDAVRPSTVTFGLVDSYMNNQVIKTTKVTIDPKANEQDLTLFTGLPVEDNDASLQKRTYKVIPLSYEDARGKSYRVTAPAIDGYEADWDVQTMSDADNRTLSSYRVHLNSYVYDGFGDSDNGGSYGYEQGNYYSIITFDHSLITTGDDIKFVMRWDDDGDNDGMRPGSVKLVLYAKDSTGKVRTVREYPMHNSQTGAVDANAAICEVTDDGNTWTYIFRDYQKYDDGKAIEYTVAVRNDNIDPVTYEGTTFDRYGYTTEYMVNRTNGDDIGDPHGAVFHRTVETQEIPIRIVWKDENNRDGQRPDYVALALMSYQWNDHTYCWENQEIETMVIRADDKNTMTASEWTYTFVPNKVYNDGVRRVYHLAVTSDLNAFIPEGSFLYGWEETAYGNQYPTNGGRDAAGYNKGMSTPRDPVTEVTISQNTNTVSVTGNIYWDDVNNQDNIRPRNVIMQLYAHAPHNPGSAYTSDPWPVEGQAYRVTVAGDPEADNWYYTFSNLPKYVDGLSGVELVYTIKIEEVDGEPLYGTYIITDNGPEETIIRYTPSYLTEQPEEDGMTAVDGLYETSDFNKSDRPYVKLYHKTETQTVDFGINWHDSNNQDRVRPTEVNVNLWKQVGDAEPVKLFDKPLMFSAMDTGAGTAWTKKLTGLSNYENGEKVTFILDMDEDEIKRLGDIGYTVTIEGNIVHMYYKTAVGDVTAKVTWSDSNNNDGYRPDNVTAELYRNGAATGDIVNLNEGNGWTFTWTGLDVKYIDNGSYGLDVVYSVKVNVPEAYTVTYTPESVTIPQGLPLDITLSHVGDTRTVPVTVFWNDNSDKDGKRPETLTVQLLADGKVLEGKTLTLSAADFTGNTWKGSFDGLPTYTDNGTPVRYSVRVEDETATNGVYQIMTAGSTLYLSHDPVLSVMYVSFNYSDSNNADGTRPTGMYLQLTADGVPVDESEYKHTVSLDPKVDGYRVEFGALPVYSTAGTKIAYNVIASGLGTETFGGEGYVASYTDSIRLSENGSAAANQVIVKLSKTAETKTVTGSVYWYDANNVTGHRPDTLEVVLGNNHTDTTGVYVLDATQGMVINQETGERAGDVTVDEWTDNCSRWSYTIENVRANYVNSNGDRASIRYFVTADTANIAPYYPTVSTGTTMNVSLTEASYVDYVEKSMTSFTLNVHWIDNGNNWGYRPNTNGLNVELLANDEVYKTIILTSANTIEGNPNAWSHTFTDLPTYRSGGAITWSARLADVNAYTQTENYHQAESQSVRFTQSMGFNFTVNWNDSENDDNVRPDSLALGVYADGAKVGVVNFTGPGETWTGNIGDLSVWRESDADAAIQYTFRWEDGTEKYLNDFKYTAGPTHGGAEVNADAFYWMSASEFGVNDASAGYDVLAGTYEWETTLSYNKEVADYYFDVSFDDDGDRDGIRPDSLSVELLADGEVIDTRAVTVDNDTASYQLSWPAMEVWEQARRIEYTIRVTGSYKGYTVSYNEANTAVTLTHAPEVVRITGTVVWDDSSEIRSGYNSDGEYLRDYFSIGRVPVWLTFMADGEQLVGAIIPTSAYGVDVENLKPSVSVTYPSKGGWYKYRDHGTEIQYTVNVLSSKLNELLADGYTLTYDEAHLTGTISHDLYDIRGTVYYLSDANDDFLLKDGAATVTAYLQNSDGNYEAKAAAETDANGNFEFLNLPQGMYVIRATYRYNGHMMAGTTGVTLDRCDNTATVIVDRDAVNDGDYYEYSATGQAFYQTDKRLDSTIHTVPEGSIVLLYKITDKNADPEYLTMTRTDAEGRYTFTNLSPAEYTVTVVFNYNDGVYTYDNAEAVADGLSFNISGMDAAWPDIIKQVNISSDAVDNPENPVDPDEPDAEPIPCVASGYVFWSEGGAHTTEPIEGVDVHVYTNQSNLEIGHVKTDSDGRWEIQGLAVGTYTAVFSKQGQSSRVLVFNIAQEDYDNGVKTWVENDPYQYFDRNEADTTGTVSGIVLSEAGYPMHVIVELYQNGNMYDFCHTDAQGKYEFTVAAGFDYTVRIYTVATKTEQFAAGDPDDELTSLDEYIITGQFVENNQLMPGRLVMAYHQNPADGSWSIATGTITDSNGKYELRVAKSGNYRIVPYIDETRFVDNYITVGYQEELPHVTQASPTSFTISGQELYDSLQLVKNDTGVIKMRIDKEDGKTYSNYTLTAQDAGVYRLVLTYGDKTTTYYVNCPANALADVTYEVTVSGEVVDENGKAIIGSEVVVTDFWGNEVGRKVILSDGKYRFSGLPKGEYTVTVTKYFESDLLDQKSTTEYDSYGSIYTSGLTAGGAWVWNINASQVEGTVTDLDGNPVSGVYVYFSPSSMVSYYTRTGEDGTYVMGLTPGTYDMKYELMQDKTHKVTGMVREGLVVNAGEGYGGIDFTVERENVTFYAFRSNGGAETALAGAAVNVKYQDGTLCESLTTDETGLAAMNLIPGEYIIEVSSTDSTGALVRTVSYMSIAKDGAVSVNGSHINGTLVPVEVEACYEITGVVYDSDGNPAGDVYVEYTGTVSGRVYTNDDGSYAISIAQANAGEYELRAVGRDVNGESKKVVIPGGGDGDVVCDLTLGEKTGADGLKDYVIHGLVVDEQGYRLENADVRLLDGNDKVIYDWSSTDSDGSFRFEVESGTYYLNARYQAENGYVYWTNAVTAVHAVEGDTDATLVILKAYDVNVTVLDQNGMPVPNAKVVYAGVDKGEAWTDETGTVVIHMFGGDYRFQAFTESRRSDRVSCNVPGGLENNTDLTLVLGPLGLDAELSKPGVSASETTAEDGVKIYGVITDLDGNGINDVEVGLYRLNKEDTAIGGDSEWVLVGTTMTGRKQWAGLNGDDNGYYEFTGLTHGKYKVEAEYVYTRLVTAGETNWFISGTVNDPDGNAYVNATVQLYQQLTNLDGNDYLNLVCELATDETGTFFFDQCDEDGVYMIYASDAHDVPLWTGAAVQAPGRLSVDGSVADIDGIVWPGSTVRVNDTEDGTAAFTWMTDESGRYSYSADADAGHVYEVITTVPVSYVIEDTASYDRPNGVNHPYVTSAWYYIDGTVIDLDGNPVEGALVVLTDRTDTVTVDEMTTGSDGYYLFDRLQPGVYHVHIYFQGDEDLTYEVTVPDGDVTDITNLYNGQVEVAVTDYTNGGIEIPELEDGSLFGRLGEDMTFTVISEKACTVAIQRGDEVIELSCVWGGTGYRFTAPELMEGDQLLIAYTGDVNLSGEVNASDYPMVAQYIFGHLMYNQNEAFQLMISDVNHTGTVNASDYPLLAQAIFGHHEIAWKLSDDEDFGL